MNIYPITDSYLVSEEFNQISSHLKDIYTTRRQAMALKYPDYKIRSRIIASSDDYKNNQHYYVTNFKIPHYDFNVCDFLLHQGTSGYLEMNEFTDQMNSFCKTVFHRKAWSDWNTDAPTDHFMEFVYNNLKQYQPNGEFDLLEQQAKLIFDQSDTLVDYYKNFVCNQEYRFVNKSDMLELADNLISAGIWFSRTGDLCEVYKDVEYTTDSIDTKVLYHTGKLTKIDLLHIKSVFDKNKALFKTFKSKFNFIPTDDPNERFNGIWSSPKFSGKVWYIPQLIIFYNNETH